ncbi:unnamed protein product [Tilletia controversa]|uniref:Sm domain-containing protein n=3 Tax=Tilletia TaxID=13289 RepID=A0A8X7MN01_9BASI|nr:hypothetical protein CF336_g4869 [Tilletia laevis]KAE8195273.1 hypothetical protein CF328_g4491 [Tilletia controversa]KAE8253379.1 hypothetical protein A4X03_0g5912 [Tilletia caries]KAE8192332.1 hypothetical protein CF335_g5861 [Tilletia laevis]KAE8242292.1 hypothetical protein A4X06_0g7044 [Tilletia controversa]
MATPISTSPADQAQQTIIATLINKIVLIHISDGRAFRGRFLCVDDAMNAILSDADELRLLEARKEPKATASEAPPYSFRWVGMVMIPGEHVRAVEVEVESKAKQDLTHTLAQDATEQHGPAVSPESPTQYRDEMFF